MAVETRSFDATNATTNGITTLSGDDVTVYDSSTVAGQAGSVFFDEHLSLNVDFTVEFSGAFSGPDGIAFVLHNDPAGASALGGGGIGMGHAGINNGIAIELDTHFNGPGFNNVDINDNSTVIRDTDFAANDPAGNITTQVDLDPVANLKDGLPHAIRIEWDASSQTFTWFVDNVQVSSQSFTNTQLDALFGGTRFLYAGLTGAKFAPGTGVANDFQLTGNFVCFANGTRIRTDRGETPVEGLKPGDLVYTLDAGYQPICWIGSRALDPEMLRANPRLRPIHIRAGALAPGVPETDLILSPQHRLLLRSKIAQRLFGSREVLIPAVKLLALNGVSRLSELEGLSYWHILTPHHQVLIANGAPAESLYLGAQARVALGGEARAEIAALFPEILAPDFEPDPARPFAQEGKKIRNLLARHAKHGRALLDLSAGA